MVDKNCYEIDYNGNVLWKAPPPGSGLLNAEYHHEFTRRANGNYMVMGMEYVSCRTAGKDNHRIMLDDPAAGGQLQPAVKLRFGTLLEYDNDGNLVWSWKSSDYFRHSDLANYASPGPAPIVDLHDNSFFFDEQHQRIWLSFRNISRIVAISYASGAVCGTYGALFQTDGRQSTGSSFCGQHSVSCSGPDVLLFNNNLCNSGSSPIAARYNVDTQAGLIKRWEYDCSPGIRAEGGFASGGNVTGLPDGSLFVSTAAPDSKVLLISPEKQVLWSAVLEKWSEAEKAWKPLTQYKASIIPTRAALEQLIWGARR
jgi:hypothetical protein